MWQFVTVERAKSIPPQAKRMGVVTHALTHRRYHFRVLACANGTAEPANGHATRKWVTLGELDHFPLPRPHVKIAAMLREGEKKVNHEATKTTKQSLSSGIRDANGG
jgi:hypothetical protein